MKLKLLFRIFLASTQLAATARAQSQTQPWSGILAPGRATDWSQTGVTGGIPNRTNICATIAPLGAPGSPADPSPINTAIQSCSNDGSTGGKVVQLQAGTFYLNSAIAFNSAQNVTLRGMGPDRTILQFDALTAGCIQGGFVCVNDWSWSFAACNINAPQNLGNWTSNYAAGTSQIVLDQITGTTYPQSTLSPGMLVFLDQLDPPSADFSKYGPFPTEDPHYASYAPTCNGGRPNRCVGEVHTVTSVSGNGPYTVTLAPPLSYHYWNGDGNNQPQAFWCGTPTGPQGVAFKDGVENLTVLNNTSSGGYGLVAFGGAAQSWMRNVRGINPVAAAVYVMLSGNIEVRDSYIYHTTLPQNCLKGGTQYGIDPLFAGSLKVENNIMHQTCSALMAQPCYNCVFGYNYTVGDYGVGGSGGGFGYATIPGHVGGTHDLLYEGNITNGFGVDHLNAHGTNALYMTVFRNYITGQSTLGGAAYAYPVFHQGYNRMSSYLGNVLGNPALSSWQYESSPSAGLNLGNAIYSIGWGCGDQSSTTSFQPACKAYLMPDDPITLSSLMRWGNFDYVTNGTRWNSAEVPPDNPVPATHNLPPSFYMSSKPSWFGTSPWPVIGPDVTGGADLSGHAGKIPAQNCYEKLGGPTDGSGSVLNFNADNCYGTSSGTTALAPAKPTGLALR